MFLNIRFTIINSNVFRNYCSVPKPKIKVFLHEGIQDVNDLKIIKKAKAQKTVVIPKVIQDSIVQCTKDFPVKTLLEDSEKLCRQLMTRHPPLEPNQIYIKQNEIISKLESKMPPLPENATEEIIKNRRELIQDKAQRVYKQQIYSWKNILYDNYKSLAYLVGRAPQEYGAITKIFKEISQRDQNFKPRSYFDFGSGVGTGLWAVSEFWKESIFEYLMVDSSRDMNDLAMLVLQDGAENKEPKIKNVFFRQFLPVDNPKYDIVLSAYSLFEQPSLAKRKEIIEILWKTTGKYLVLVEYGSNAGFKLLNEARSHLLQTMYNISVFSPCPHSLQCPQFTLNDGTPCNFEVKYQTLTFGGKTDFRKELFSYIVFKRSNDGEKNTEPNWPRLIRPTLVRPRHVICRMCTENGKLQEIIFTKRKHDKLVYRCAKNSRWGDTLPVDIKTETSAELD